MTIDLIFFISGIAILSCLSYSAYSWYLIYAKTQGADLKTVFQEGFFEPKFIKHENNEVTSYERIKLNILFTLLYTSFSIFILLFISTILFLDK